MAITFEGTSWDDNGGSTATSVTATKPASLADDDVVVLGVYMENNNTITWPSGFVEQADIFNNTDFDDMRLLVATKVITDASSEPASYTTSWSGSTFVGVACGIVRGVDTTDILSATTSENSGRSATITASGVTTDTNNSWILVIVSNYDWNTMSTPSGTTFWVSTLSGGFESVQFSYFEQATAGATGDKTSSMSSTNWAAVQLAFKPAGAASGGIEVLRRRIEGA